MRTPKGRKTTQPKVTASEATLNEAMAYVREHFAERPTLRDIAAAVGLSIYHLHRQFRLHFGRTPLDVISGLQVERAKELLLKGVPLADVAGRCGFTTQSHLSHRFKMKTGLPPAAWLKRERARDARDTRGPGAG